jgi:hypothetical protein
MGVKMGKSISSSAASAYRSRNIHVMKDSPIVRYDKCCERIPFGTRTVSAFIANFHPAGVREPTDLADNSWN